MNCSNCPGVEDIFNSAKADEEIRRYRELGPHRTTQMLVNALKDQGVEGLSLLDIGGGVGVLQNELLRIGVAKATSAEAVPIYADVAKEEAKQQGHLQRITYQFGDFVEIADQVPHADIVTLDSVLCCYPDMKSLVTSSVRHADKFYGIIFPRDTFLGRATVGYWNVSHWLKRTRFRSYTHATEQVSKLIGSLGMQLVSYQSTPVWQVVLYARTNQKGKIVIVDRRDFELHFTKLSMQPRQQTTTIISYAIKKQMQIESTESLLSRMNQTQAIN